MSHPIGVLLTCLVAGCASLPATEGPAAPAPAPPPTFETEIERLAKTFAAVGVGRTLAVLEFPDLENRTSDLSRLVSEELTTDLVRALGPRGKVVERRQVIQVLQELDLAKADLTQDEVQRVGRRLGATAIVLGSTAVIGREVVVNARLVGVSGIEVVAADRMRVAASADLLGLAGGAPVTPRLQIGAVPRSAVAPQHGPVLEWTNRELRVELLSVERKGGEMTVSVLITNMMSANTVLTLSRRRIYLVDDLGARYGLVDATGFEGPRDTQALHQLVPQLARRLTFAFEGVTERAKNVTLVFNLVYGGLIGCCAEGTVALGPAPVVATQ